MKHIKKSLCAFLMMFLLVSAITPVMADDNIKVRLGGELIKFDVQPQLINNRTMVPLRAIFEALGAAVNWNGDTQTVTSTKDETTISLSINNPTMYVNGEAVTLDSPACLVDGRTLVPVRAISEAFDLKVDWNGETRTVIIKKIISVISEEFVPITQQVGQTWKYTYDSEGKCISRGHDAGLSATLEYDGKGNLTKITNTTTTTNEPLISISNYTYDSNGNCILETDEFGWKKYTYNDYGNVKSWTNSNAVTCEYTYDENNRLVMESYSHGMWTKYEYNSNGQLVQETTDDNSKIIYTYDNDKLKTETGYDEQNTETFKSTYEYDSEGNLIFVSSTNGYWAKYIQIEI